MTTATKIAPCLWFDKNAECRDRFGLSWQIVPRVLNDAISDADTASAKRAMEAMMTMKKIDVARIEAARRG